MRFLSPLKNGKILLYPQILRMYGEASQVRPLKKQIFDQPNNLSAGKSRFV